MAKTDLRAAQSAKKDEFYTQLGDIAKELKYYKSYFKDKVVFCNCDDPYESNFFKYFALNFKTFGLKKSKVLKSHCWRLLEEQLHCLVIEKKN